MSEPMLDAKLRDLIEKRQAATIRGWWNDGPRKTWRSDFADPATRDAWFEELSRQLVANFPFGALLAAVPALSEPGGLAEGDVAARVNSVLDGIGIYPAASPEGPRTPWQDGWNAGVEAVSSAVEAALAQRAPERSEVDEARPEIVTLCGSTRFYDEFQAAYYDLTMDGMIVLSVGFYPHALAKHGHGEGVGHDSAEKVALDELHKRKIDISDWVYVINIDGYIGDSTRSEIEYAEAHGKPVRYWEPLAAVDAAEEGR